MDRAQAIARLDEEYDFLVVGGGATGLGTAVDATTRGYRTLLVTSGDFAQATSSRSTKLIHGGVRYLERGDIKLVREALHERGLLLRNAPNVVHDLRFLIPCYSYRQMAYYGTGVKLYDFLAGGLNLTSSGRVRKERALALVPTLCSGGLKGGVVYSDGQFNDSRLAISLARTAQANGAILANYMKVTSLTKKGGRLTGAVVVDQSTGREYTVRARVVVNATGIFTDELRRLDDPYAPSIMAQSRGTHIVLDRKFLPGSTAILVPKTSDGRVVFIIPWDGRTLVGTTDIPVDTPETEPVAGEEEIDFLLRHAAMYLSQAPRRDDVLAAFAGMRPLVKGNAGSTARLSRDHTLLVSDSGLVTITGGKWTTYRRMAQDAATRAAEVGDLPRRACVTERLKLAGSGSTDPRWRELGATAQEIFDYEGEYTGMLHPNLPYSYAMAAYVIDNEMPVQLEDVLSRRLRALLLDAQASVEAAPGVARLMAERQGRDAAWVEEQVAAYRSLARKYGIDSRPVASVSSARVASRT